MLLGVIDCAGGQLGHEVRPGRTMRGSLVIDSPQRGGKRKDHEGKIRSSAAPEDP